MGPQARSQAGGSPSLIPPPGSLLAVIAGRMQHERTGAGGQMPRKGAAPEE